MTITLKPNLANLGIRGPANARLKDIYRAFDFTWQPSEGWRPNEGDPETPRFSIKGEEHVFPMVTGTATVTVPKRDFRALLLEAAPQSGL